LAEQAERARGKLDNYVFGGASLQVELVANSNRRASRSRYRSEDQNASNRTSALPLRILVPSEFVGAIIGRKGQSIRSITTRCKARVDVHGRENGLFEKVILIYGQPENCTSACREILSVIQQEAVSQMTADRDVELKMLANDGYCGRLIGREGRSIKKLREATSTKIVVTGITEIGLYPDRVISIRGSVDNVVKAEAAISLKLANYFAQDMKAGNMYHGISRMPMVLNNPYHPEMMSPIVNPAYQYLFQPPYPSPTYVPGPPAARGHEVCHVCIPNAAVGAIIGSGGANIKQVVHDSGASVAVDRVPAGSQLDPATERTITIKGSIDCCWRASYFIFERMKLEGYGGSHGEVELRTIVRVPASAIGRIIGKNGKNVREIQRLTGAIVKLPPTNQQAAAGDGDQSGDSGDGDTVSIDVYGNFMATQGAHSRIRQLIGNRSLPPSFSNLDSFSATYSRAVRVY